jgi:hypothetical protein
VAVMGAVSTGLSAYFASAKWEPAALSAITALGVYLVPNKTATPAVTTPVVTPNAVYTTGGSV